MANKRIEWLDLAKALTMFFVIFDHLGLRDGYVSDWVWLFHLPAFFLLSGVFYHHPQTFWGGLRKDAVRLLLPVIIWWAIAMLTWQPFIIRHFHKDTFWSYYTQAVTDFFSGYHMSFGWFMIALFLMKVEMYGLKKLHAGQASLIALVIMPLGAWSLKAWMEGLLPFYIMNSLAAFPFFYVGHMLSEKIKGWPLGVHVSCGLAVVCFVVTFALVPLVGHMSLNAVEYGHGIGWMYLSGLIGSLMILSFSYGLKKVSKYYVISVFGGGTVILLLFQPPFLYLFKIGYKTLFHVQAHGAYFDTASAALASLLIMLMMYPAIVWINRHAPILNGLTRKSK